MNPKAKRRPRPLALLLPTSSRGVGLACLALSILMGLVGGGLAVLIRVQLSGQGEPSLLPETYLSVVTLHGSIMVFCVALPALFSGIGALVLAPLLGRERLAWHGLHALSNWLLAGGSALLLASLLLSAQPPGAGLSSLPPLSALEPSAFDGQDLWGLGMGLLCLALLMVCLVYLRTCALEPGPKPIFVRAYRIAAALGLISLPVMLLGLGLLTLDRHTGTSFFLPAGMVLNDQVLAHAGGLPLLFRSLFWHLGHPSMLLLTLPALGIALEVTSGHLRGPLFGARSSLLAMALLALGSLVSWGLGIFEARGAPYPAEPPSALAFASVGCLLVVGLNLAINLLRPGLRLSLAMHFVVALLVSLVCAALGGLWLAMSVEAQELHGSYVGLGHLHLLFGLVSLMALFAALHQWYGPVTGRRLDPGLGKLHFWLSFVSLLGVFLLMQFQGFSGLLRHHWDHSQYEFAQLGQQLTPLISGLTYLAAGAQALLLFNLISSRFLGEPYLAPSAEQGSPGD